MNRRTRRIAKAMKRVAMPVASAQLRSVVQRTHRRFDREFAARIDAEGKRAHVPCAPGCAACCERAVVLTWAEADLIVAQHPDVVAEVLPELERHNTLLAELGAGRAARTLSDTSAQEEHSELLARWFTQRVPCAFLDAASKHCRVYESRPLACRSHAVTSPPEVCALRPGEAPGPRSEPYGEGPEHPVAQLALMTATSEALGGTVLMGLLPSLLPRVFRERLGKSQTLGV
jgi:Fe-S-cluster containining protein